MNDLDRNKKLASATMKLLERVEVKGAEVPMFVEIHNWLQTIGNPPKPEGDAKP